MNSRSMEIDVKNGNQTPVIENVGSMLAKCVEIVTVGVEDIEETTLGNASSYGKCANDLAVDRISGARSSSVETPVM